MGRRKTNKPGKTTQAASGPATGPGSTFWGETFSPNPFTGRFEVEPTAPAETVEFFRRLDDLVPSYGGTIPESAAMLDEALHRPEVGILPARDARTGSTMTPAELAARAGLDSSEARVHIHHLHRHGWIGVTTNGLIYINRPAT